MIFRNLFRRNFVEWATWLWADKRDFGATHIKKIKPIPKHEFPKFNQYKDNYTKHSCTFTNAIKDLCYNYNIQFDKNLIYSAIDYAEKHCWYNHKHWYETQTAMKCVRKRAKEVLNLETSFVRLWHTDEKVAEYKRKGYMIGVTFNGNNNYVMDYAKDWVVDWIDFKPRQRGHRTSMYGKYRIWDSEYWFKYNDYSIKHFNELVKNWVFYPRVYIWTLPEDLKAPVEDLKRLKQFELDVNTTIDLNSKMWKETNDKQFKKELHNHNEILRKKLKDIEREILKS